MDKMDRLLGMLPVPDPAPELVGHIRATLHRRQRRRQMLHWTAACVLAFSGLWLVSPAPSWWLSSGDLYSPAVPWLAGSLDYVGLESFQLLERLWNGVFSLQNTVVSSLEVSVWLGILLLGLAAFFAVDGWVFETPLEPYQTIRNAYS